jgi:phospholipase A1
MLFLVIVLGTATQATADVLSDCLLNEIRNAPLDTTVGEVQAKCAQQVSKPSAISRTQPGVVEERLALEKAIEKRPWVITPHKPNYILGYTKNSNVNTEPFTGDVDVDSLREEELKFQLSFKFPLWYGLFGGNGDLYAAYTNQSWWQAYSSDISQPFREVNHEPEIFVRFTNKFDLFGMRIPVFDLGLVHQSNGRGEPLSRSWNRLYANFLIERGNFAMSLKPWVILGESKDNPDIEDFMGYGEIRFAYRWQKNVIGGMLRNNLKTDENRSGIELSWSYPVTDHLRLYTQYYYGYGESLLDYNSRTNRIGIGVALNDYVR